MRAMACTAPPPRQRDAHRRCQAQSVSFAVATFSFAAGDLAAAAGPLLASAGALRPSPESFPESAGALGPSSPGFSSMAVFDVVVALWLPLLSVT